MVHYKADGKLSSEIKFRNAKIVPRKLLLEKSRRAKINSRLDELRNLLFEDSRRKTASYGGGVLDTGSSRQVEKADILQESIKFVRNALEKERQIWQNSSPAATEAAFMHGYMQCVEDLQKHVRSCDANDDVIRMMDSVLSRMKEGVEKKRLQIQDNSTWPSSLPLPSDWTPPQTPEPITINQQQFVCQQNATHQRTDLDPNISNCQTELNSFQKGIREMPRKCKRTMNFECSTEDLSLEDTANAHARNYGCPLFVETTSKNEFVDRNFNSFDCFWNFGSKLENGIHPDDLISEGSLIPTIPGFADFSMPQIWRPW